MDSKTVVIIWLSLQITLMSVQLIRDARRIGYLEGQQAGQTVTITESDGMIQSPYTKSHRTH